MFNAKPANRENHVKHVAMWQLKDQADGNTKQANAAQVKSRLESLKGKIKAIRELEVGINLGASEGDYDIVLTVTFNTTADLKVFLDHPAFQEVAAFAKSLSDASHAVDYDCRIHPSDCLRALILAEQTLVMPDAYDALSAKVIEQTRFPAVQCSGYSMALAAGLQDECQLNRDYNLEITRQIVNAVSVPVMADGEDGYGPPEKVGETVCLFMEAGVAGINIEDQVLDGETAVKVVDRNTMEDKLKRARDAADRFGSTRLVINARTDVLRAGPDRERQLSKAAQRANAYLEAGADMVFVPYVTTMREAAFLKKEIVGPLSIAAGLSYNMEQLSVADLCELRIARVSLPTLAICTAMQSMKRSLSVLRRTGRFDELD